MKTLRLMAWISGAIAAVLIIMGCISLVFSINLFGVGHSISFFHGANSFLLAAIVLLLAAKK
jgi:putative Mn2+ efflux pump MntP